MASSSTMSAPSSLVFGAEMELLVRPKEALRALLPQYGWDPAVTLATNDETRKKANRKALRSLIAYLLTQNGIPASITTNDYTDWTIADEPSLDEVTNFWRVEIVSRATKTSENWQTEFRRMFALLNRYCDITLTKGCSMHVHVSLSLAGPDQTKYLTGHVRNILKGVSYFDEAITKIMPADRKTNQWAMSNVHHQKVPTKVSDAYRGVTKYGWKPLFALYDRYKSKAEIMMQLGSERYLSWNFQNLPDECGTIEFRRPPGVKSAEDAQHWVSFALGFISMAMEINWAGVEAEKSYPDVETLREFVVQGLFRLESSSRGGLNGNLMVENRSPATVFSAAELESIKRKKAAKKNTPSVFVEKTSRPNTPVSSASSHGSRSDSSRGSGKKMW